MPSIDVVIVNWNTGNLLHRCLESISAVLVDKVELRRIVVVDNNSFDGSANMLEKLALPLVIIRNDENRGFAAACNQGASGSGANYLLFLNPDTRLKVGALERPVEFLERPGNRSFGIVGIQLIDDEGRVARTCSYHPKVTHFVHKALGLDRLSPVFFSSGMMLEWDHMESRPVDAVIGAFYLVRRSLFNALGGFDERFFVYYEEADFGFRAKQLGQWSYYMTEVQAYHRGCGSSDKARAERLFYSLQSRILYGIKHFGRFPIVMLLAVTLFLEPFVRIALAFARRSVNEAWEVLGGYGRLWASFPDMLYRQRISTIHPCAKKSEGQKESV